MASTIINIADRGDVILVVGGDDKVSKLKVDSHMLQAASEPFKVMFGPNFQEGRVLSYDDPKEISLGDDDADAMETICWIIHLKSKLAMKELSGHKILKIAKTIDKYLFHDALDWAIRCWLQLEVSEDLANLLDLVKSALILRQPVAFKRITKLLIMQHTGPYVAALQDERCEEVIKVLRRSANLIDFPSRSRLIVNTGSLDSKRSLLRINLIQAVYETVTMASIRYPKDCTCIGKYSVALSRYFERQMLQPRQVATETIAVCLKSLQSNQVPSFNAHISQLCADKLGAHYAVSRDIWQLIKPVSDFEGLSLDEFL